MAEEEEDTELNIHPDFDVISALLNAYFTLKNVGKIRESKVVLEHCKEKWPELNWKNFKE